ncbi:STM3941 family protein [uncultured Chryseobacterium sp.]|uniref:STM3941 family protein n=1 Tax=uncultured Chryseobacterium sp. TaxID=259322 RepID=UPI0025DD9B68|nr:STM3941 family protein [uncultured Chryseobacterium sp.]
MRNIRKNNLKLIAIILVMLLILGLGIIAVINPGRYVSFIYRNSVIIFIIGIISIILSSCCIYEFGRKLIRKDAVLTINNEGINDGVNILDYPFIHWKNILNIEECSINNIPHLKVFIDNPQQYINQKVGFKKWILKLNLKKHRTPILLNAIYLACSFENYKKNVIEDYKKYKLTDKDSIL